MKGERIVYTGNMDIVGEGLEQIIKNFRDQVFLATTDLVGLSSWVNKENKPTVGIINNFRDPNDTKHAANLMHALYPGIKVIVIGADLPIESADFQLSLDQSKSDLEELLLNLTH